MTRRAVCFQGPGPPPWVKGGQLWLGVRAGHRQCLVRAKRTPASIAGPEGAKGAQHGTPGGLSWGLGLRRVLGMETEEEQWVR